jgi:hypothetical protein
MDEAAGRQCFGLYFRRAEVAVRLLSLPLFPIAIVSVFALQGLAQTAPSPDQDQVPVFKANARAVLIDVVVTDSHGNPVSGLHAPDVYAAIQRSGVPAHFEIDVPSDKDVFLSTGVYDWGSGKAGTLEIPISSVAIAASLNH